MRRPPTRAKSFRPRWAPGPWQPSVNIPQAMRQMAVAQVRTAAWPRERHAVLQAMAGGARVPTNTFFLPRSSIQNAVEGYPVYASGPGPVPAITSYARQLAELQRYALVKHVGGQRLTPREAEALFSVKMPRPAWLPDIEKARRRGAYGRTVYDQHGGARQVPFFRQTPRHVQEIIHAGRARAYQYGVRAGGQPYVILKDPRQRAREIARRVEDQYRVRGF